jgi:methanogenic corrinoid protein MtbC1
MYSDEDIERLMLLRQLRDNGESIGQMARLDNDELRELARSSAGSMDEVSTAFDRTSRNSQCIRDAMAAIRSLDQAGLESCLLKSRAAMEQQRFLEETIAPLLDQIGRAWDNGRLRAAHEHMASSVVRSVLGSIMVVNQAEESSPLLVSTTPVGQQHELGALMAAVTAASIGWRTVYLGPNLPSDDIAAAAAQGNARAIALSLVYPPDDPRVELELKKLKQLVGENTELLVGGRAASAYSAAIGSVGAELITDLRELRLKLNRMRNSESNNTSSQQT